MKILRICLVSYQYPPHVSSGPGKYMENLVNFLVSKGHSVTVITSHGPGDKQNKNLRIIRLSSGYRIFFYKKLRKFFSSYNFEKTDLLHVIDKSESYFVNSSIPIPVVVSVNDTYALESPWNLFSFPYFTLDLPFRYLYYVWCKYMDKKYLPRAHTLIANSKYTCRILSECCPHAHKELIYRGIHLKDFHIGKKIKHVLFVGKNMVRKGVFPLIRSIPAVLQKHPDCQFTIVGTSTLPNVLYLRLLLIGMKNVKYFSSLDRKKLQKLYSQSSVFCILSYTEALGQVQLEAMASGARIVGSKFGGIPETITNETGILVNPYKIPSVSRAIISSLDKSLTFSSKKARRYVENKFSDEKMGEQHLLLYSRIVQ